VSRELEEAYRAPSSDAQRDDFDDGDRQDIAALYVVAVPKLVVLFTATAGAYAFYWFYKQFRARKRFDQPQSWPLARAFFAIFHVHRLFRFIDAQARATGAEPSWNPDLMATIYVIVVLGARALGRVATYAASASGSLPPTLVSLSSFALPIVLGLCGAVSLAVAQSVANRAQGDPSGKTNSGVDAGSVSVCLIGAGFWALLIKLALLARAIDHDLGGAYHP